jgi:hypothetical protein
MPREVEDLFQRLLVADLDGVVDLHALQVVRHTGLADALRDGAALAHRYLTGLAPGIERAAQWIGQHDARRRVMGLEREGHAGQGAAGAAGAGEGVHPPIGLDDDLGASGAAVPLAVVQVVELVGPEPTLRFGHAARDMDVIAGVLIGLGGDEPEIGADHAQKVDLFLTLRFRHHDDAAIAARIAHQGQADAGIAGRALDQRAAGLQVTARFGAEDDGLGSAILHRAAGVHEFRLAQDVAAGGRRGTLQADQGRLPDGTEQALGRGRMGHGKTLAPLTDGVKWARITPICA